MTKKKKKDFEDDVTGAYPQFAGLDINPKQASFVYWYCHPDFCYNGTRAYAKAYGLDTIDDYMSAQAASSRLLSNVKVQDAVDIERKRRATQHEEIAAELIEKLRDFINTDPFAVVDALGPLVTVKSLDEIPVQMRPCIKSIKTTSNGVEVTFYDKLKSIELLGKALGMFIEKTQSVSEEYEGIVERMERKRIEEKNERIT